MGYQEKVRLPFEEALHHGETPELKRFFDNYRLAYYIAKPYLHPHDNSLSADDVVQEALAALWETCYSFDESRGFQFSTYAGSHIRFRLLRLFRDTQPMKVPRSFLDIQSAVLKRGFSNPLSDEEIYILHEEEGFSLSSLNDYVNYSLISVDAPIGTDDAEKLSILDTIADRKEEISTEEMGEIIELLTSRAKPRYKDMITEWLYSAVYDHTVVSQAALGRKYKMSQAHVNRVLMSWKKTIRRNEQKLLDIVGVGGGDTY